MQEALMVDCMCVWLYAHLGTKVMEKASTVLGSKFPFQLTLGCNTYTIYQYSELLYM